MVEIGRKGKRGNLCLVREASFVVAESLGGTRASSHLSVIFNIESWNLYDFTATNTKKN